MPAPIGESSRSVSVPPEHIEVDSAPERASVPLTVTIPPVYIEGEAASARRLVDAHDAANAQRSCLCEGVTAAYGALEVAGGVVGTVLVSALGPFATAGALATLGGVSYSEGQKLRALYNCETE